MAVLEAEEMIRTLIQIQRCLQTIFLSQVLQEPLLTVHQVLTFFRLTPNQVHLENLWILLAVSLVQLAEPLGAQLV